ncbi:PEP-CTERM sorting domain-containing protein [Rivibacter subsaxonicus]|uniref:PEP-CTERM sorting domain-containing protein n=1 Tax=Rivibacter subsaxonicus TaxID=457575 RepID=UPI00102B39EE|nr:PEP-CTERM sorting domain-containing protein [Rivibacter subsaxonicus]
MLAIATVMSIPALAEDQYIFGYGDGGAVRDALVRHGSEEFRPFELGWYASAAWHAGPSQDGEATGRCLICTAAANDGGFANPDRPGADAAFSELAGGIGYDTHSRAADLYADATIARDRPPAADGNDPADALEIPPARAPGTYALMLAGLGAIGFVATRRRV